MRTSTRSAAPRVAALAALAALMLVAPAAASTTLESRALRAVTRGDVYAQPSVAKLVDEDRLAYAARIASRAADGAPMKIVFVDVPHRRLNALRDRLFEQLDLGPSGALVVGTPQAVAIRTRTLTSDQENGIVALDAHLFRKRGAGYTEPLAELVYDVGLVIHNSRPGATPRGEGRERNLATFSGTFQDERRPSQATAGGGGSDWTVPVSTAWIAGAFAGLLIFARLRWRRLSGR
jgi:hypothetical protein